MKNAMKKLLSLVLVAMLLVSVVPMGAMAADDEYVETVNIGFVVNVNGKQEYVAENMTQAPGTMLNQLIDSMDAYGEFDSFAASNGAFGDYETAKNYEVVGGEIYTLNFTKSEEGKPTDPPATEKKDVTLIVKVDGEDNKVSTFKLDAESAPLSDLLYYHYAKDWKNNYNFVCANRAGETFTDLSTQIYAGDEVSVRLEKKNGTTTPDKYTVTMKFLFNDSQDVSERKTVEISGKSTTIADLLTHKWDSNWSSEYEFVRANCKAGTVTDINTTIYAGETINIRLRDKNVKPDVEPVHYVIKLNNSNNVLAEGNKTPSNGKYLVVRDLLDNWSSNWNGNYDFSHAQIKGSDKNIGLDGTVSAGKTVYIMLESEGGSGSGDTSKYWTVYFNDADNNVIHSVKVKDGEKIGTSDAEEARDEVKNDKKGYTFEGWRLNGAGNILSTNTIAHTTVKNSLSYYPVYSKDGSDSDKLNSNKVYLHIFLDNRVTNPAKDINITDGIAKDGVVTLGEVKDVVKKYYSAKNDDGIIYDGLYFATGSWVGQFVKDEKVDRIEDIDDLRKEGYVHINVMVNNAKAKTNSNADSSNPKTGDDIYMTVTVMGLSAAALCAVYYISKKRAVR